MLEINRHADPAKAQPPTEGACWRGSLTDLHHQEQSEGQFCSKNTKFCCLFSLQWLGLKLCLISICSCVQKSEKKKTFQNLTGLFSGFLLWEKKNSSRFSHFFPKTPFLSDNCGLFSAFPGGFLMKTNKYGRSVKLGLGLRFCTVWSL